MSEEKLYIKDLQLIREFCINSDKEDVYKYIYSLQQENQQLKEALENLEEINNDKSNLIVDDIKELLKYKSVLDEIREYIVKNSLMVKDDKYNFDLLQILDKVKE